MRAAGFDWTQVTVAQIEGESKRQRRLTIEELLMLAALLGQTGTLGDLLDPGTAETIEISEKWSLQPGTLLRMAGRRYHQFAAGEAPEDVKEQMRLVYRKERLGEAKQRLEAELQRIDEERESADRRLAELRGERPRRSRNTAARKGN